MFVMGTAALLAIKATLTFQMDNKVPVKLTLFYSLTIWVKMQMNVTIPICLMTS
jgi:hypothetical protein